MSEELLNPSLSDEDSNSTQSYNISKLYYAAFFGGIIPTIALGTINFKWLKMNKKVANLLIAAGILVLVIKVILYGLFSTGYLNFNSRYLKWSYKIACVALYFVYYMLMKDNYRQHMMVNGRLKPLLKDSIKWIIIGIVIEFILLLIGRLIIQNAIR